MQNVRTFFYSNLLILVLISINPIFVSSYAQNRQVDRLKKKLENRIEKKGNTNNDIKAIGIIDLDSVFIDEGSREIRLCFSEQLSHLPIREALYAKLSTFLHDLLVRKYRRYSIQIYSNDYLLRDLIPNTMRKELPIDEDRLSIKADDYIPLVRNTSIEPQVSGLFNCNIALWHSHGLYYEAANDRWEFQRPRLFGTVEDLSPMTYVLQYLTPMLENAGATVFLPREWDPQKHEVIVDNDKSSFGSTMGIDPGVDYQVQNTGFLPMDTIFPGDNPFQKGSSLKLLVSSNLGGKVKYFPEFPDVSYGEDYAVGLNISRYYQIGRIYEPLYLCRRWEDNSDAILDVKKLNAHNHYKDKIRTLEYLARKQYVQHNL